VPKSTHDAPEHMTDTPLNRQHGDYKTSRRLSGYKTNQQHNSKLVSSTILLHNFEMHDYTKRNLYWGLLFIFFLIIVLNIVAQRNFII
jgi:hypothetical protein